jgi:acyl-CoA synthetase (AMP-forming)/AMP-acid ligase II
MPEPLLREIMAALPGAGFLQSYGMTELSPVVTILNCRDHLPEHWPHGRLRSAGRPVLFAEVGIVDAQDRLLPPEEVGEIVARGPNVMLGYWNRPDLTAEALRGGWMHTGDIGYFDEEGYLYLADRRTDMILVGGSNVYPAEIEAALEEHDAVQSCAVIGLPDDDLGNKVHAIVQTKGVVDEASLRAHLADKLVTYKQPRSYEFVDEPLRDDAGKVRRSALREARLQQ